MKYSPQQTFEVSPAMLDQVLQIPQGNIFERRRRQEMAEAQIQAAETTEAINQQKIQEYEILNEVRERLKQESTGGDVDIETQKQIFIEAGMLDQARKIEEFQLRQQKETEMREHRDRIFNETKNKNLYEQQQDSRESAEKAERERARAGRSESRASETAEQKKLDREVRALTTLARQEDKEGRPTAEARAAQQKLAEQTGLEVRQPPKPLPGETREQFKARILGGS